MLAETEYGEPFETLHPQVEITTPIGTVIEVDKGLADFLRKIWTEGYVTLYSCQGGGHRKNYIMFPDMETAKRFQAEYGGFVSDRTFGGRTFVGGAGVVRDFSVDNRVALD